MSPDRHANLVLEVLRKLPLRLGWGPWLPQISEDEAQSLLQRHLLCNDYSVEMLEAIELFLAFQRDPRFLYDEVWKPDQRDYLCYYLSHTFEVWRDLARHMAQGRDAELFLLTWRSRGAQRLDCLVEAWCWQDCGLDPKPFLRAGLDAATLSRLRPRLAAEPGLLPEGSSWQEIESLADEIAPRTRAPGRRRATRGEAFDTTTPPRTLSEDVVDGLLSAAKKLCFYPSSGTRSLWAVMDMDAELFVFSDYLDRFAYADEAQSTASGRTSLRQERLQRKRQEAWELLREDFQRQGRDLHLVAETEHQKLFRSGGKWGLFLFRDNNEALQRIVAGGGRVDFFVGINDGCREGGNGECIHDAPFLGRLLAAAASPLTLFTDHSPFLEVPWLAQKRGHTHFKPWIQLEVKRRSCRQIDMHAPRSPWPDDTDDEDAGSADAPPAYEGRVRFELHGVLVYLEDHDEARPQPFHPAQDGVEGRSGKDRQCCQQLQSLAPLRNRYGKTLIAEYRVIRKEDEKRVGGY